MYQLPAKEAMACGVPSIRTVRKGNASAPAALPGSWSIAGLGAITPPPSKPISRHCSNSSPADATKARFTDIPASPRSPTQRAAARAPELKQNNSLQAGPAVLVAERAGRRHHHGIGTCVGAEQLLWYRPVTTRMATAAHSWADRAALRRSCHETVTKLRDFRAEMGTLV
jgi:hypothetical protein